MVGCHHEIGARSQVSLTKPAIVCQCHPYSHFRDAWLARAVQALELPSGPSNASSTIATLTQIAAHSSGAASSGFQWWDRSGQVPVWRVRHEMVQLRVAGYGQQATRVSQTAAHLLRGSLPLP